MTTELSPPQQHRSQQTLDRLVEACEGLLREKSFEEISVGDIVRRGRSSVGAFYGRFKGKDALLQFLDEKREEEIASWWENYFSRERWKGATTEEILRRFVLLSVRAHREKKGVLRALFLHLRGQPTVEMLRRTRRVNRTVIRALRDLLTERRDEIAHPNPDLAVLHGLVMVVAAVREWLLFEDLHLYPTSPTDDALAEELARAFVAYLGISSPRLRTPRRRKKK